jgi:hypothetical protein
VDLYLRKSEHGQQSPDIYRVILKDDGDAVEIGSISVQHSASAQYYWKWAIDAVIPMRAFETSGRGTDRADCMRKFKEAWTKFVADEANLTMFLAEKRRARRAPHPVVVAQAPASTMPSARDHLPNRSGNVRGTSGDVQ